MTVHLQVDITGFHLINNLFDMGIEFVTIPTSFEYSYSKKNPINATMNNFVIEHWKTPPQTLSISGVTRFRIDKNFLADKIPWAVNLDTITFNLGNGNTVALEAANLIQVSDTAYWVINRMGLYDQKKISDVLELKTRAEINAKLQGREDRVRTFIYFNYSIYEVMFNRVSISRDSTKVIFKYNLTFDVLDYKSVYDYVYKTKMGKYAIQGLIGADVLGELIRV